MSDDSSPPVLYHAVHNISMGAFIGGGAGVALTAILNALAPEAEAVVESAEASTLPIVPVTAIEVPPTLPEILSEEPPSCPACEVAAEGGMDVLQPLNPEILTPEARAWGDVRGDTGEAAGGEDVDACPLCEPVPDVPAITPMVETPAIEAAIEAPVEEDVIPPCPLCEAAAREAAEELVVGDSIAEANTEENTLVDESLPTTEIQKPESHSSTYVYPALGGALVGSAIGVGKTGADVRPERKKNVVTQAR